MNLDEMTPAIITNIFRLYEALGSHRDEMLAVGKNKFIHNPVGRNILTATI